MPGWDTIAGRRRVEIGFRCRSFRLRQVRKALLSLGPRSVQNGFYQRQASVRLQRSIKIY